MRARPLSSIRLASLFVLPLLLAVGCGGRNFIVAPAPVTDVYVSGYASDPAVGPHNLAALWKNGTLIKLTDGTQDAVAAVVTASGSTSYAIGTEGGAPRLWKDGLDFTPSSWDANMGLLGIAASGTNVYVAGWTLDGTTRKQVAAYWLVDGATKASTPVLLTDGTQDAQAWDVKVPDGNEVYLVGFESNGTHKVAELWVDDRLGMPATGMPFTDGTTDAQANAVFVSGTTAYAVGVKSNGTNNIAMTWTKGNQDLQLSSTELTTGDLQASGNDIKLLGTNAYAVGWEADGNRHLAKVWLNTTPTTLVHRTASFDDLTSSTEANGVFLVGTDAGIDVYVSGSLADPSGASTAVYWLNDQIQVLSGAPQSSGNNIFALRH